LAVLNFDEAVRLGEKTPRLHSLLASWRGQVVLERYFHGRKQTSLANIKSASKSVLAALIGIAIDRKLIPGVATPIATYFPEIAKDAGRKVITVEDLLTMQSGLRSTSNRYYGAWVASPNWVRHILTRPVEAGHGTQMIYSTGNTHLLSAILTKASKSNTWAFGQQALAKPLGFNLGQWPRDPQGIYFGGNDMLLTPRQMLEIGELYLHNGKRGDVQVVPQAWVKESCTAHTISPRNGEGYGYGWWIGTFHGVEACYAWGFGGQYIFVMPKLDLVIAATSSPNEGEDRRQQRGVVFDIVEEQIVPQIARVQ
jgi:CubicO group peptidase (beta-lactamase class C family)